MTQEASEDSGLDPRRYVKIAAGVFLGLFVIGWAVLRTYFSSNLFQNHLDTLLRPQLKNRGIVFDEVDVSALGQIQISNLRIRLPDGQEILVDTLDGYFDPTAMLKGEARVTFDVSKLAKRYLGMRQFGGGEDAFEVEVAPSSQILYVSLASSLANLGTQKDLRGEIQLRGVHLNVLPKLMSRGKVPLRFEDGTLSLIQDVLTSDGLRFSLPEIGTLEDEEGREKDVIFTFDGNIRNLFGTPEFVGGRVHSRIRTEPVWQRSLDFLRLAEVNRKIRFFGPLDLEALLEGPVASPDVEGKVDTTDLLMRMRGEFRQINIRFSGLTGKILRHTGGGAEVAMQGGKLVGEYFRHVDKDIPHLFLRLDGIQTKLSYDNRVLRLDDLKMAGYGGVGVGYLEWDLNVRDIELGPGRFGDTRYKYELGMKGLDLEALTKDITTLTPMGGVFRGYLEGSGDTLMLERMSGSGRFEVRDLRVRTPPTPDRLRAALGPESLDALRQLRIGSAQGDWSLRAGELVLPSIESTGPDAILRGDIRYNILSLDLGGALGLTLQEPGASRNPGLRAALGVGGRIAAALGGRVVSPRVAYEAAPAN